jgi:hypothetical protein
MTKDFPLGPTSQQCHTGDQTFNAWAIGGHSRAKVQQKVTRCIIKKNSRPHNREGSPPIVIINVKYKKIGITKAKSKPDENQKYKEYTNSWNVIIL